MSPAVLIIYHSRDPLPARLAAALHGARVPDAPPDDVMPIREALGGDGAADARGLWMAGDTADGLRLCALGRASRPDVVHRAFYSLADTFGLNHGGFLLQRVGGTVAWTSLKTQVLQKLGLRRLALQVELKALQRAWGDARRAVAEVRQRVALHRGS